jgi:hypothetical protein
MGDAGADNNKISTFKRSDAVRSQFQGDTHFLQHPDRTSQLCFVGLIGHQNPGTLPVQEAGGCKSGAAEANHYDIFVF